MRNITGRRGMVPAGLMLLALGVGCGDGTPSVDSSTAEATISGKVTIRGKPVGKGKIVFDPSNIKRKDAMPVAADIGPDGTYKVKTLAGLNQVTFTGPPFLKEQQVQDAQFQFTAKAGENTFDPDLPPKYD